MWPELPEGFYELSGKFALGLNREPLFRPMLKTFDRIFVCYFNTIKYTRNHTKRNFLEMQLIFLKIQLGVGFENLHVYRQIWLLPYLNQFPFLHGQDETPGKLTQFTMSYEIACDIR